MPNGVRIFLVYAFAILVVIGLSLRFVIDMAISAPVSLPGVVVMILLAYTIFTITLVLQRKEVARGLALGLASLTIPAVPLGVLQLHRGQHRPGRGPGLRRARHRAVPGAAPPGRPGLPRPALSRSAHLGCRSRPSVRLLSSPVFMSDLPFTPPTRGSPRDFAASLDVEGKIPRALEALGPVAGRDVLLVDGEVRCEPRQLADLGARVRTVPAPTPGPPLDAPDGSADVVVGLWSAFRAPMPGALAEADRVLRPDGRLLVVHDYGRDDVCAAQGRAPEYGSWSRRDGWYLAAGFRIRVIHCFWTFGSIDEARTFLGDAFGPIGEEVGRDLQRPRLTLQRGDLPPLARRGPSGILTGRRWYPPRVIPAPGRP